MTVIQIRAELCPSCDTPTGRVVDPDQPAERCTNCLAADGTGTWRFDDRTGTYRNVDEPVDEGFEPRYTPVEEDDEAEDETEIGIRCGECGSYEWRVDVRSRATVAVNGEDAEHSLYFYIDPGDLTDAAERDGRPYCADCAADYHGDFDVE